MRLLPAILAVCTVSVAAAAFAADEPMDRTTPNKSETMNDCVRKHQALDVNLAKSELKRICKNEIKQNKTVADAPPPQDTPKN